MWQELLVRPCTEHDHALCMVAHDTGSCMRQEHALHDAEEPAWASLILTMLGDLCRRTAILSKLAACWLSLDCKARMHYFHTTRFILISTVTAVCPCLAS